MFISAYFTFTYFQYIRSETSQVLVAFSVNESIRRTAVVLERMPVILSLIPKNLEKVGTLTDYGSPTNLFSRMDYELEQDFLQDHTSKLSLFSLLLMFRTERQMLPNDSREH